MTVMDWFMSLFDAKSAPVDSTHTKLDMQQNQIADRLSKLTGQTRDDVFAEAYRRRGRLLEDQESYRRHRS